MVLASQQPEPKRHGAGQYAPRTGSLPAQGMGMQVIRTYDPDPEAQIQALFLLLRGNPGPSGGELAPALSKERGPRLSHGEAPAAGDGR